MQSQSGLYIARLDHLRFFAASLVVLYHTFHRTVPVDVHPLNPLLLLVDEGHTAVTLFLVISGFIFATLARGSDVLFAPFILNRVYRIYPLLVFAVLLGASIQREEITSANLFWNYLTPLSTLRPSGPPLVHFPQLWSVLIEMQIYLLFPLLHRFGREEGQRYFFGVVGLMILTRLLAWAVTGSAQPLAYWTIFGRLDQFAIGVLLAEVHARGPTRFRNPLWLLGALAFLYIVLLELDQIGGFYGGTGYPSHSRVWIIRPALEAVAWGTVVITYLQSAFSFGRWGSLALNRLGEVSYSIYVMHLIVLWALWGYVGGIRIADNPWWNALGHGVLFVLPATCAVSFVTYRLVERPFLRMRRRYLVPLTEAPAVEVADPRPTLS